MKRQSLKKKITLWYATFMILLTGIFAGVILFVISLKTDESVQKNLINTVEIVSSKITDERKIDFKELLQREIDNYKIGIYGSNGDFMAGTGLNESEDQPDFLDSQLQSQIFNYQVYYVYDKKVYTGQDYIWIRGYMRGMTPADNVRTIKLLTLILLPILALLMLAVGYVLTGRALHPLKWMIEEADSITGGDDLNKRVEVPEIKDEISYLGITMNQMLERLERSFSREKQFTSDASHELRTPISIILAQCELAEEDTMSQEEERQAFETIQRQALKMKRLIEDLLQLSRLEQDVIYKDFIIINVSELVTDLVEEQIVLHGDKASYVLQIEVGVNVFGNEMLLARAFMNLLNNAYQYGGQWIQVTLAKENGQVSFSVEDHGQGIKEENIEKIWDRFYQVESSRTYKGGFGLGLSMVKSIVELHGGTVSVNSKYGEGSTFRVNLPQKK